MPNYFVEFESNLDKDFWKDDLISFICYFYFFYFSYIFSYFTYGYFSLFN